MLADLVASVLEVPVSVGARVAAGDTLVVMESMKMQIPVAAPRGGVVADVRVEAGDIVSEGDTLVVIEVDGDVDG